MKKTTKTISILFAGLALTIGIAISGGIIRNSYVADEVKAENATMTIVQGSFGTNITTAYDSGAEKTGVSNDIDIAAKAVMKNGTNIQMQASNGLIYNIESLPGKIVSVTISQSGTLRSHTLFAGTSARLVNNVTGNYTVTGGTSLTTSFQNSTFTMDAATNYKWFALKNTSGNAAYIVSLSITYETLPPRTLTDVSVTGEPTKKVYYSGESFDPTGITVTATFSDSPSADVTSSCVYSPNPLILGTTSVSVDYTEGAITKSASISGITVNPAQETKVVKFGTGLATDWTTSQQNIASDYIGFATTAHYAQTTSNIFFGPDLTLNSTLNIKFKIGSYGGVGPQGTLKVALLDSSNNELTAISGLTQLNNSTESYTQGPGGTSGITAALPANPLAISSIKIFLSDAGGFDTAKYMRLEEVTFTYTPELKSSFEANAEAVAYGTSFLSATSAGCTAKSSAQLIDAWSGLEASYNALSSGAKAYLTSLTPNEGGNDAEHAVARYVYIITKYGDTNFNDFMNLNIQSAPSFFEEVKVNNLSIIIVVIIVTGLSVLLGYYYLNKKKEA